MYFQNTRLWFWAAMICGLILLYSALAHAQLADLDLLEDDDRSIGIAVTRAPDPTSGYDTESRSGILLLPVRIGSLNFEGGAGAYFTQSIADGASAASLQWRVQGGPQFGYIGLQFYVEGFWKQGIDYAGFFRIGEFDLGSVIVSGGFGTLVRADTQAALGGPGIERNAAPAGDQKVKGLLLASAEVDTQIFESLRILGTVLPGFDGEHDVVVEPQVTYAIGAMNIAGQIKIAFFGVKSPFFLLFFSKILIFSVGCGSELAADQRKSAEKSRFSRVSASVRIAIFFPNISAGHRVNR